MGRSRRRRFRCWLWSRGFFNYGNRHNHRSQAEGIDVDFANLEIPAEVRSAVGRCRRELARRADGRLFIVFRVQEHAVDNHATANQRAEFGLGVSFQLDRLPVVARREAVVALFFRRRGNGHRRHADNGVEQDVLILAPVAASTQVVLVSIIALTLQTTDRSDRRLVVVADVHRLGCGVPACNPGQRAGQNTCGQPTASELSVHLNLAFHVRRSKLQGEVPRRRALTRICSVSPASTGAAASSATSPAHHSRIALRYSLACRRSRRALDTNTRKKGSGLLLIFVDGSL